MIGAAPKPSVLSSSPPFLIPVWAFLRHHVGQAVLSGGDPVYIFESAGEMQLVGVAHLRRDFPNGLFGFLEQLGGASHAVVQQIFLRALAHRIPENFAEIAAVQPADSGDVLDGNIVLVSSYGGTPE